MLAFLPWCTLRGKHEIAGFEIEPYEVGASPQIDSVLKPYQLAGGYPIKSATLIRSPGRTVTADLSDTEIERVFDFSEALKLSGLARRKFFAVVPDYCNSDTFSATIQAFPESGAAGTAIRSRRRDRHVNQGFSPESYVNRCSPHVEVVDGYPLDEGLAMAAMKAIDEDLVDGLDEAVLSFNLANTDSDQLREHVEVVLLVGAFERLLACNRGQVEDLETALGKLFANIRFAEPNAHKLVTLRRRYTRGTVAQVWIRDLFAVRGELGHGKKVPRFTSAWDIRTHLLLGAYLFPRALFVKLESLGVYKLTEDDLAGLFAFPLLACLRNPFAYSGVHGSAWTAALDSAESRLVRERLEAVLEGFESESKS